MRVQVNLTRIELLRLRRRLTLAVRGHKLLDDKLQTLMAEFTAIVPKYVRARQEVWRELPAASGQFLLAGALSSRESVRVALNECRAEAELTLSTKKLVNVRVPVYRLARFSLIPAYSFVETPAEFDLAIEGLRQVLPKVLEYIELEESVRRLAKEIEKTHRRVNALQYVVIPQLRDSIRLIRDKLEERDRETKSQLLKIKEMIEARR